MQHVQNTFYDIKNTPPLKLKTMPNTLFRVPNILIPIKGSCTPASQADFVAVAMTSILRMRTASESS